MSMTTLLFTTMRRLENPSRFMAPHSQPQLPDGRLAIVNCESKFAEHMAGRVGNPEELPHASLVEVSSKLTSMATRAKFDLARQHRRQENAVGNVQDSLGILDKPKSD